MAEEDKSDKQVKEMKKLTLLNNLHNVTPQIQQAKPDDSVAIVNALKSEILIRDAQLQLEGWFYSHVEKKYIVYRKPVMNNVGIGNFISALNNIARTIEFSSIKEDQVGKLSLHLLKINYPYYTIYHEDYELDRKDFNLIYDILFSFIVSSFMKAKGAGHRNVVRGTYSEDMLGKFIPVGSDEKERGKFSIPNLFKRSKEF